MPEFYLEPLTDRNGTEAGARGKTESPKKKISITKRSGLQFSVPRVLKNLKGNYPNTGAKKIKPTAAIYMAAILEYLSAEILELAGNASRELRKKTVQPRHLLLAIKGDAELDTLIKATIPGGGVIPHIHKFLFPEVLTDILPVAITPSITHGSRITPEPLETSMPSEDFESSENNILEIENVSINSGTHPFVCLTDEVSEDVKPALKDLVANLGGIPNVIQCHNDSEEEQEGMEEEEGEVVEKEQEVVEELLTTREESMDTEMTEIQPVASTPTLTHGSGMTPEPFKISMPSDDCESNEYNLLEDENACINSAEHPAKEHSIPTSNILNEVSIANLPSSKESSAVIKEGVIQETLLESIESDNGPEEVTISASATPQHISAPLPQDTDLLNHLNAAILKRQEDLKDYLVIGNMPTPILHYRCGLADKGQSQTDKLLPTEGHVVNEFSQYGSYQEQEVRKKRGRKKKTSSAGSETSVFLDDGKFNVCKLFSSLRYLSAFKTSHTLIKPEILNIIWKSFFLDSNEVLLHLKAEDVLKEYFMFFPWSKDSNRLALMDSMLNSLRDVSDQSMFSKFERENSRDTSDVFDFFEKIIICSTENVNQGAISLLDILVFVFKIDFTQWWKEEEWKGEFPMIYYVLGVSYLKKNMIKIVAMLFKNRGKIMKKLAREFLSLTAMLSAFLDHSVEKEDYIHQGYKMELAEVIANVLHEEKDPAIIFVELSLLQPSWLSLLVSKCLLNVHQSSKKTPRLCEISSMMQELSLGSDIRSSYLFENLQYRLVCMSQSHLLLRANWFFTSNKEKKTTFEVFSKMKELPENSRSKRRDVTFKCLVKVSLERQTEDLITISDIARGVRKVVGEPGGAERALMFVMTGEQDLGWQPAIP